LWFGAGVAGRVSQSNAVFFHRRDHRSRLLSIAAGGHGRLRYRLRQFQPRPASRPRAEQLLDPTIGAQDYESVLELTYRAYFRKSAIFFQPDIQYVINPGGTGRIDDALVLGCQIGFNF
jgi:hypothetical protein